MVGRWDSLNGVLGKEFLSGLTEICIWIGAVLEEHHKSFTVVHCVILDADWGGGQGDQGICQFWKRVPCGPGRFLAMPHECGYRVTSGPGVKDREGTCLLWAKGGSYSLNRDVAVVCATITAKTTTLSVRT